MLRSSVIAVALGTILSSCSNHLSVKSFSGEAIAVDSSTVRLVPDAWKDAVTTFKTTAGYLEGAAQRGDKRLSDCSKEPAGLVESCRTIFSSAGSGWRKLALKDIGRSRIAASVSDVDDIRFVSLLHVYTDPNGVKELPARKVIMCSKPIPDKSKRDLIVDSLLLITYEESSDVHAIFGREACAKYAGYSNFMGEFDTGRLSRYESSTFDVTDHAQSQ